MKQLFAAFFTLYTSVAFSCDVCGCASGPGFDGMLNNNTFHFVGLRATYNPYTSIHRSVVTQLTTRSQEQFFRGEILGRWQFATRWNVEGTLPYVVNYQMEASSDTLIHGFGDALVKTNWNALVRKGEVHRHILTLGAGFKLPTGRFVSHEEGEVNLAPGSGSWDPLLTLGYRYSFKRWNMLVEQQYQFKTANRYHYRYGDLYQAGIQLLYRFTAGKELEILPMLGVDYQYTGVDKIAGVPISDSYNSGQQLRGSAGLQLIGKSIMVRIRASLPIYQSLANGEVRAGASAEAGFFYLLHTQN